MTILPGNNNKITGGFCPPNCDKTLSSTEMAQQAVNAIKKATPGIFNTLDNSPLVRIERVKPNFGKAKDKNWFEDGWDRLIKTIRGY